jgi:hypothetical protein
LSCSATLSVNGDSSMCGQVAHHLGCPASAVCTALHRQVECDHCNLAVEG